MKSIYFTLLSLTVCAAPLTAQPTSEGKGHNYTPDRIQSKSNWLSGENPAGLITNYITKSYAQASYGYQSGTYRSITEAPSLNRFDLKTESYKRFDRFSVYGRLEYLNDRAKDRTWFGSMHPEKTSLIVGDSISGQSREEYYMLDGGFAYEMGKGFSIGAMINYEGASMAKRKDPRNENYFMNMRIRPGITYRSQVVNAGLNFDFDRFTQSVNYNNYGTNEKATYYFVIDGLWFYRAFVAGSTNSPEPRHTGMTYGGSGQIELSISNFKFFNQLSVTYGTIDRYSRKNVEMMGSEENLNYKYLGILSYSSGSMDHLLKLKYNYSDIMTFSNIQRLEYILGSMSTQQWYQYGKILKLSGNNKSFGADYSLYLQRNDWSSSWIVQIGFESYERSLEYNIVPILYSQQIKFNQINFGITKNIITCQKSFLDLNLNANYFTGGNGYPFKENIPQGLTMNQVSVFTDLIQKEYDYLTSDRFVIGGKVRFTHELPTRIPMSIYAEAKAHYTSVSSGMPDAFRRGIVGTIGLNF
ncbi:MAG: hypothetical protein LBC84_02835 [Prevotellaceae bacterium]|nr:hypothetical protein [Prevotellaceae bacterium]